MLTFINVALTFINVALTFINVAFNIINVPLTFINVALTVIFICRVNIYCGAEAHIKKIKKKKKNKRLLCQCVTWCEPLLSGVNYYLCNTESCELFL